MTALVGQDLLDCVGRLKGLSEKQVMEGLAAAITVLAAPSAIGSLSSTGLSTRLRHRHGLQTRGYHREPSWEAKAGKKGYAPSQRSTPSSWRSSQATG